MRHCGGVFFLKKKKALRAARVLFVSLWEEKGAREKNIEKVAKREKNKKK